MTPGNPQNSCAFRRGQRLHTLPDQILKIGGIWRCILKPFAAASTRYGEVPGFNEVADGLLLDSGKLGGAVDGWFWLIHFDS